MGHSRPLWINCEVRLVPLLLLPQQINCVYKQSCKMDHYEKGENVSFRQKCLEDILAELSQAFPGLVATLSSVVTVKPGSKMRNLISPGVNQMNAQGFTILVGSGAAVTKLVSVGEIVKRKSQCPQVRQANSMRFEPTEEHWVPKNTEDSLEPIKVVRQIPMLCIFLAKADLVDMECLPSIWTRQPVTLAEFFNTTTQTASSKKRERKPEDKSSTGSSYIKKRQKPRGCKKPSPES
jgi:hypothetical protein